MFGLVVIVALVATVIVGTVLGKRYRVGPPVLLILLGALLGLIPRFGRTHLDGELVLLLFLPAILYWESMNTSFREIRANMRVIVLISVGLVIATAVAVSWTARAMGMESHAAAVLGAVLSPTDAAAVAGLAKRLPRRPLTVLRAESIINDGTALVLFAVTVAVATGSPAIGPAALVGRFVGSYLGGIVAGLAVGLVVTLLRHRLDAPLEEGALSIFTPFAAFLLAQTIGCSGVVAVLVAALVLSYVGPRVIRARSRLQAFAFWDLSTFLINGSLWVFVGVQIPGAVRGIAGADGGLRHAALVALAVTGVVVVTRFAWMEITTVVIRAVDRRAVQRARRVDWRQRTVSSWAGFRGAVSLAAALAVPLTTRSGAPFADRSLIIFVVSAVILVTVLVQGSTLPLVVRWARMPEDVAHAGEMQLARSRSAEAALDALPRVADEVGVSPQLLSRLEKEYEEHAALATANPDGPAGKSAAEQHDLVRRVRLGVLEYQRRAVTELRDQNRIDDIVLRELQAQMDLEEVALLDAADSE
ncbi:Na+/H+ antiporter [Mycobacterium heckeshornense]|uniref:Putative Na(+)/H(+) exchanger n=1 Tax=Mycobacterium heckeshornense TaxID=110505 RepID=A0A2I3ESS2_9MYCO|nr:Na+/H+ antiporter [Mycobacterium heckeshornense]KMV23415.1 Na+/H+ transporter [Mycobacterium heckeshornense]MCV7032819.1 Na+/H+ antiporter [Mycobacterium heckeshornense]BCO35459.1 putative Na(+)/H(+) exchanger [Mycobacterium heckeshornense]BCQ08621.1 putative Na(+)/H(+) exchanger [Mycobacterium heckeshornense]